MAANIRLNDDDRSSLTIAELSLDPFVRAKLKRNGVRTAADLQAMSAGELILLNDCGIGSLRAVRRALAEHGLILRDDALLQLRLPGSRKRRRTA